ncbi:DUF1308 domain-containing protein [Heracleum sosnowskyi]|uniref:DUF1308 domain-containing protein n=1 Tax=Heracleum sosnowskyi TaxID=360622 RepID=A0AAD8IQ95_9APIA|nr:DUF1308 domain-containing protein [Heracleum sosnowskyi]
MEEAKRRCMSVEQSVEKNLKKLNTCCKQTLLRLIRSELSFLSRFQCHNSSPLSVNIGHLEAVVHILKHPCISGVSRVCKPIPRSCLGGDADTNNNVKGVYVDIICTLGGHPVWFLVSDRNPKYIYWHGNPSKALKIRIQHLLDAASSCVSLRPSSIILFFSNGLRDDVSQGLRNQFAAVDCKMDFSSFHFGFSEDLQGDWVHVLARSYQKASLLEIKVERLANSSSFCSNQTLCAVARPQISASGQKMFGNFDSFHSFVSLMDLSVMNAKNPGPVLLDHSLSTSALINFDTTALIAIVSGISNGCIEKLLATPENELRSRFKGNYDFVIAQVMSEVQNPIHMELGGVVSGKGGIICKTVCSEFKELVSMCGGPNEKSRAKHLLEHLIIVPDSPSTRMMSLATTRKLALKNKIVFGTGDSWHAPTLSANMAFVRAVSQTGMSLLTMEHRPRALTGD